MVFEAVPPPPLPVSPRSADVASRRSVRGRWILAGVVGGLIAIALVVVGSLSWVHGFGRAVGRAVATALTEGAAGYASRAEQVATDHRIPMSALTPALLNRDAPTVRWVPADASTVSSGITGPAASIATGPNHALVAAQLASCDYGLVVTTASDPIIAENHLPGVGTYYVVGSDTTPGSSCSATAAPSVGWHRADPADIRTLTDQNAR